MANSENVFKLLHYLKRLRFIALLPFYKDIWYMDKSVLVQYQFLGSSPLALDQDMSPFT